MEIPEQAHITDIQLRFVDTDMAGHVNHATFVTYLETARVEWIKDAGKDTGFTKIPIIIAHVEIDYLSPIHLQHRPKVAVWTSRIGSKSFDFSYCVFEENDGEINIFATAKTVQVYFDYENQVSITIPYRERELLNDFLPQ